MQEESSLEKTEPASQRRLDQAREEGDVPRSREMETFLMMFAAAGGLWFLGESLFAQLSALLASGLTFDRSYAIDFRAISTRVAVDTGAVLLAFAPLTTLLTIVAVAAPSLIGGWLFSAKAFQPNFSRLAPLRGVGNIFSVHSGVELCKAIGKALLVGGVALLVIWYEKDAVLTLGVQPLNASAAHLGSLLWFSFLAMSGALLLIALVDVPHQLWQYARKLRMTREQVRQETRESEGDPEIKARIRTLQRAMARRRMMSEIPTADVVVTNPTHYAVALRYTNGTDGAPRVVAKGAGEVATKIRMVAEENSVPQIEAPPLARALYRHAELGDEIPRSLYTAVAEVLAYVFQLRAFNEGASARPVPPSKLAVPSHLDPEHDSGPDSARAGSTR